MFIFPYASHCHTEPLISNHSTDHNQIFQVENQNLTEPYTQNSFHSHRALLSWDIWAVTSPQEDLLGLIWSYFLWLKSYSRPNHILSNVNIWAALLNIFKQFSFSLYFLSL